AVVWSPLLSRPPGAGLAPRGPRPWRDAGPPPPFNPPPEPTCILSPGGGGGTAPPVPAEVRERYGVEPHQVPDFIALRGDPSDKLPGVPGLGATGAAVLLQKYGTLENALLAGRYPAYATNLRLFRTIATMDRKAPLPRIADQRPTWGKASALARRWQLNQLADRLAALEDV